MKNHKLSLAVVAVTAMFASCRTSAPYSATDAQVTTLTPVVIESNFKTQYPDATNVVWGYYDPSVTGVPVDWQLMGYTPLDHSARLVHFNQGDQSYHVLYDMNGIRVATAQPVADLNSLPSSIRDQLLSLYPNYVIDGLSRVTLNSQSNKMAYEVEMKKMYYTIRLLVDDNGNIIDQRTIVNDNPDKAGMREDSLGK